MKPKTQGTRFETWLVNQANTYPNLTARRLPEGGVHDQGDIEITNQTGTHIVEAKHRQALNPHLTLHNTIRKAASNTAALAWKRTIRKPGNTNRTPTGEPTIICITLDRYLQLLNSETPPTAPD